MTQSPESNPPTVRPAKVIAFVNQKGGVGKTTSAVNIAAAVALAGKRVLLIDMDPQGNASTGVGISSFQRKINSYQVLTSDGEVEEAEVETEIPNLKVMPATVDLSAAEFELRDVEKREYLLKSKLEGAKNRYDFIFIDCPPALGLLTLNSLVASDTIIVPMQCEFYALEGLSHILKTIEMVKKALNPAMQIEGVLLTMYDKRYNLTAQVESDVREYLGNRVFHTVIPRNVRVSEAPSHGKPVVVYDKSSAGATAYTDLARELIERQNQYYLIDQEDVIQTPYSDKFDATDDAAAANAAVNSEEPAEGEGEKVAADDSGGKNNDNNKKFEEEAA